MRTSAPHLSDRLPCFLFQRVRRREFALRCATDEILQELFGQHCMPAVQVHVPVCAKSPNIPTPFFSRYTSSAAVNLNAISSLLASVHSDNIGREPERPYSLEGMLVQVVKTQEVRQHYFRDHVGKDRLMNSGNLNLNACNLNRNILRIFYLHSSKRAKSNGHATDMKAEESVVNLSN